MEEWDEHGRGVVSEGSGLEEYVERASGGVLVRSWVLGHTLIYSPSIFTASKPNGHVGAATITRISVSSVFQTMMEFNPATTVALMVFNSGFIPYEASLSVQPMVK
jgi:hypothetical protein